MDTLILSGAIYPIIIPKRMRYLYDFQMKEKSVVYFYF